MRNLFDHETDKIEMVVKAVNDWCRTNRVDIESDRGRRAVAVAINFIWSRDVTDFHTELHAQLEHREV